MNKSNSLFLVILITLSKNLISENIIIENDSIVYYENLSDKFLISLGINSSFSNLTITNKADNSKLLFQPVDQVSIAAGLNYKWLGIALGMGLPSNKTEIDKKGNTSKLDLQLNIYSKRIGADLFFQHYKGFHLDNPNDFTTWNTDTLPQLPNMEQYAIGASSFYIFNYNHFSYRAPFIRNAKQIKSAGSILGGIFINLDAASADGGFVHHDSLPITLRDSFPIFAYSSASYGLSFGYSYTFVISPRFFINLTLMPGFGIKNINMETFKIDSGVVTTNSTTNTRGVAGRIMFRTAIGYEKNDFIIGSSFYSSQGTIAIRNFEFQPGLGNFRIFIAKRFGSTKHSENRN